jgi:hypothetical protein
MVRLQVLLNQLQIGSCLSGPATLLLHRMSHRPVCGFSIASPMVQAELIISWYEGGCGEILYR